MNIKIGINGFGRIGKGVLKASLDGSLNVEVVAINSTSGPEKHAHIFKYDSLYGKLNEEVSATEDALIIGSKKIKFTAHRDPADIPWKEMGVDIVIESTGLFLTNEAASKHLKGGAKKVIISAPAKGDDVPTFVMGVNEGEYNPQEDHVISNASCTTNCLAPIAKILEDKIGIESGLMTTVHAYTNDQNILDLPHKDLRRARAAAESIIPTTTGAAKAVGIVIPSLKGKLNGMAMRVPIPVVSIVDLVVQLKKDTSVEEVNRLLKEAAEGPLEGILGYSEEPLVSADYKKDPRSSIVDALSTMMVGDKMIKVVAWYDNEWGYSNRALSLAQYIGEKL
ncbi:type I glyceraldehyde-3-phosphate dehydrogenase [Alkaliphilus peptidifermentans]|uniref:Glyceraldehyde-3-phosphate dehydrogenase n=1 Tax=Alkaliphilus peptidifermentans DSM 18978 TaxID=1120976 RepID=A0A1G5EJU3_9FIRM|nr:type I glyceraldehyde-3-phosphate dehydrogenase [Alkaliphilus peptidifermentans]SCY27237.1 glyceraldehyde-3-phosphate dehydrogenase (NAD+) [Alkaliphilus peptidifermentans DSM 18978]